MRNLKLFLILVVVTVPMFSQNTQDEYIKLKENKSIDDLDKIKLAININWSNVEDLPKEKYKQLKNIIDLSIEYKDSSSLIELLYSRASIYETQFKYDEALNDYNKALRFSFNAQSQAESIIKKVRLYSRLGNRDSTSVLLNKVKIIGEETGNNGVFFQYYNNLGVSLFVQTKFEGALKNFKKARYFARLSSNNYYLAQAYEGLGAAFQTTGNLDSATFSFKQAIQFHKTFGENRPDTYYAKYNLALAYYENNNYDSCLLLSKEIGAYCKRTSNDGLYISVLNLMGVIYQDAANYERAIEVYEEMEPFLEKSKNQYKKYITYSSIGQLHWKIENYKKAENYYLKSLEITKEINSDEKYLFLASIANINVEDSNYIKARQKIDTVLKYYPSIEDPYTKNLLKYMLGVYYQGIGNNDKAFDFASNFSPSIDSEKADLYYLLFQTHESNNTDKSLFYLKKYTQLTDSINKKSNKINEQITFAEFFVEKANIERDLTIKEKELVEQKNETYLWTIIGLVVLISLIIMLIVIFIRLSRKLNKEKEETSRLQIEAAQSTISHSREILQNQSKLILDKNRVISELKENIESYFGEDSLKNEKIQHFLESKILTKEDWDSFKKSFSVVYPDFITKATSQFDKITESELRLLCLSRLGMDKSEIANMLGVLPKSVQRTINRFQSKHGISLETSLESLISIKKSRQ